MFKKILVCLDGSKLGERILPYATEEALHFKSMVVLVRVVMRPITMQEPEHPGYIPVPELTEQIEKEEKEAKEYLESIAQKMRDKGIKVESVVLSGTPGDVIVRYADDKKIDLIAMATHGRTGIERIVFGSAADTILRKTGLPILVIKPKVRE
jgi:nucleotide-binding universal stress UspA family protein